MKALQKEKKMQIHHKSSVRLKKQKRGSRLFLAPSFLGVLTFYVVPFLVVIFYSVVDNPISKQFVFLENFQRLLKNHAFKMAVTNTLTFSAIAVPLATILSMLLAMLLESKIPFRSQFRTFFLSPMMVPVASVVLIWQVLFHYNGVINEITTLFGVQKIDWLKSDYSHVVDRKSTRLNSSHVC